MYTLFPPQKMEEFYKLRLEGKYTAVKQNPQLKENVQMYRVSIQNYKFLQSMVTNYRKLIHNVYINMYNCIYR